jgi:hypothetical protein
MNLQVDPYRRNFEIFKNLIWLNLVLLKFYIG